MLVLALVAGAGTACSDEAPGPQPVVDPSGAAVTSFAGLEPATGDPVPAGLESARPALGTVARVSGPFDDRFALGVLRLRDGVVTGRLTVTSDVSELLELEVVAGFYDARGRFLGTSRWVHHLGESGEHGHTGPPEESETFRVVAPGRLRERVASAAVGVPVLVNE